MKKKLFLIYGLILGVSLSGCAKPLDDYAKFEETKKIVKKTTIKETSAKESSSVLETSSIISEVLAENPVKNPVEESLMESFNQKFLEFEEKYENGEYVGISTLSSMESANSDDVLNSSRGTITNLLREKGAVNMHIDEPIFDKSLPTISTGDWRYGQTPIEWVFVDANTKLISNTRPGSSKYYSNKASATSGALGCIIPVFSKSDMKGNKFDGRLCCFSDMKESITSYTFKNDLSELTYKEIPVSDILEKNLDLTRLSNGVLVNNSTYINIIYLSELDEIIEKYY